MIVIRIGEKGDEFSLPVYIWHPKTVTKVRENSQKENED
jgi:hypothetical protein